MSDLRELYQDLILDHVLNYPNPFTTYTQFFFEHNQPSSDLDILVQIFTISGKLVKTIDYQSPASGYRVGPIEWDGRARRVLYHIYNLPLTEEEYQQLKGE